MLGLIQPSPPRSPPGVTRRARLTSPSYATLHRRLRSNPVSRDTFPFPTHPPVTPAEHHPLSTGAMLPYSAGDHRRSPPPRGAFSSSLSPSAAPFPAADPAPPGPGRDLPTAPSVYAAAAGDWGNASWIEPPVSYMAPVATPSAAAPGYKDDGPHGTLYGIYSRINYNSDFPGLQSIRSESSNLLSEKHPRTCQENSEVLSGDVGPSVFTQQQNSVVSKLLDHSGAESTGPYPPRQDTNQYPFGSSYDKYVTQLSSCSTDTQPHILSAHYVNSSEMAKRTAPVMNGTTGESSFSASSYMNPCRINLDYFDCTWNEQKDIGYQTTDKQYGKWSNSLEDTATSGNYPLNPLGENYLGVERSGNRRLQESSDTKCDTGNFISKFSSSEIGFLPPREFSSELLEVNNTSVDSPCWKGTPATYPSPFGIMENKDAPRTVIGAVGYNSSYQSQKAPEINFMYPAPFPECQEVSGSENDLSKVFKLPVRFENFNNGVPRVRVYPDVASHATYWPNKQHAATCCDPVEDSKNVITSSQNESSCPASKAKLLDEHSGSHTGSMSEATNEKVSSPIVTSAKLCVDNLTSGNPPGNSSSAAVGKEESTQKRSENPSQCYPGAEAIMLNMSSDSSSSTRAIFLKLMHNLSVALLSTCKDGSVFSEDEEGILQSVIQNLTAASSKRSKIEQKTDDGLSNSSQMLLKNVNCVKNIFWAAMHEHLTSESDLEFKSSVSKVLTSLPEDKILDDTKVSEASIYKNLWIETEASACKLKYELQLARMKLATMKGHNNTVKVSHLSEGSKGSNSSTTSKKSQNLAKESTVPLQHQGADSGSGQSPIVNRSTVNGVDNDVFARLKVLQSRTDNVTSFGEFDCEGQQEVSKKACEVEDAVIARLKVLKSCPDNATSLSQESMPDARINRADDAVMARLRILESRPHNVSFLGQESRKQEVDAGTNKDDVVDDAVMARLRILKSRPDNVTSMCDFSKEHEEACDDQSNRDGVEVMSSRHIFNVQQTAKFMQCFDSANHLERNNLTSGLESVVDGTCTNGSADVASPKPCDTPSEEMIKKDAVQGEVNLGGNHVWPQAAGESNVKAEGFQEIHLVSAPVHQYGSSPSEWEHVLKENFFHPSK
ncbi:hypothetical protein QOZ80_2AG0115100 [Eleusine coracana subsp. coracana]|nr:hypothetical protein QOZ80_2AG0115100 [Eleusine coracana subsp. coracana]